MQVRRGQKLYGEAAAELATNLVELQRGRGNDTWVPNNAYVDVQVSHSRLNDNRYSDLRFTDNTRITDKPQSVSQTSSMRHRKEPHLPRATPISTLGFKSPPSTPDAVISRINQTHERKRTEY